MNPLAIGGIGLAAVILLVLGAKTMLKKDESQSEPAPGASGSGYQWGGTRRRRGSKRSRRIK